MKKTSGISLMVLIFLSLCLITFSLLSLSGATADETLSTQAAERTTAYYAAVSSANETLSLIDRQLAACLKKASAGSEPENAYYAECSSIPDAVPGVGLEDDVLSFSVPITDSQELQAKIKINYPAEETEPLYRIVCWATVNTQEWTADQSQRLYVPGDIIN